MNRVYGLAGKHIQKMNEKNQNADVQSLHEEQCHLIENKISRGRTGLGGESNECHFGCTALKV